MASPAKSVLQIQSVTVGGKAKKWHPGGELSLGWAPEQVVFNFGPTANSYLAPKRLRYTMEGYESIWHEGDRKSVV